MRKKNKIEDQMRVEERQYRAVITKVDAGPMATYGGWSASVQVQVGLDEWSKVRCGLRGIVFPTNKQAEDVAKEKIRIEKSLDRMGSNPTSYIIYDDAQ